MPHAGIRRERHGASPMWAAKAWILPLEGYSRRVIIATPHRESTACSRAESGLCCRSPDQNGSAEAVAYSADLDARMRTLFVPQTLANGLGETVAKAGLRQLRIAETEKYPHVTYFLNAPSGFKRREEAFKC